MKIAWLLGIALIGAIIFFSPKIWQQEDPQVVAAEAPQPIAPPKRTQAATLQRPKQTQEASIDQTQGITIERESGPGNPIYRPLAGGTGIATKPGTSKHDIISGALPPGTTAYRPGVFGVGYPSCLYCPDPPYSDEARKAKFEGVVTLQAIIQLNGHATDIQVVKSAGLGLDEKAVDAVRTWRFKPAIGPDGTPVPTIAPIEVNFRVGNH